MDAEFWIERWQERQIGFHQDEINTLFEPPATEAAPDRPPALSGQPGLRIEAATETAHGASRRLAQRIAGKGRQVELAVVGQRQKIVDHLAARVAPSRKPRRAEDDVIVDMMTDKAAVEVSAPVSGRVASLHGDPGDIVAVGTNLIVFDVDGEIDADRFVDAVDRVVRAFMAMPDRKLVVTSGGSQLDALRKLAEHARVGIAEQARMRPGVVADLEPLVVQRLDLLPSHIYVFSFREAETLGNEERRIEAMLLEQWRDNRGMTLTGVIKRQDHCLLFLRCTHLRDRCQKGKSEYHGLSNTHFSVSFQRTPPLTGGGTPYCQCSCVPGTPGCLLVRSASVPNSK